MQLGQVALPAFNLHPEILLLVPHGLVVIGYSFRRRGGTTLGNPWPARIRTSKILPADIVKAIMLSVSAPFAVSPLGGGSACARELPSGSILNPSAGTVMLPNGSVVAIAKFPCSMTSVVWQTTGIAAVGRCQPLALVVVATTVLLYFVAGRRPIRDLEPPLALRLINAASWNGYGVSPFVHDFIDARSHIPIPMFDGDGLAGSLGCEIGPKKHTRGRELTKDGIRTPGGSIPRFCISIGFHCIASYAASP